ncbi:DUF6083 domain-containing protein [Streptomyces sp. NPDC006296]|uniref:DUF6083 domain-containing protein n=1 Tax=Streptomyces sp. NPDC006296 TaxID=3156746 RepID=UPI0033A78523
MGDPESEAARPDRSGDGSGRPAAACQAHREGATGPSPPAPPACPSCGLPQDRYPTEYPGHWILLEPRVLVPAHTVPPRRRWIITSTGTALNLWDAEPLPGARCRVPHHLVCPWREPEDHWPEVRALRRRNAGRAGRLFELPDEGLPDEGLPGEGLPGEGLPDTG